MQGVSTQAPAGDKTYSRTGDPANFLTLHSQAGSDLVLVWHKPLMSWSAVKASGRGVRVCGAGSFRVARKPAATCASQNPHPQFADSFKWVSLSRFSRLIDA